MISTKKKERKINNKKSNQSTPPFDYSEQVSDYIKRRDHARLQIDEVNIPIQVDMTALFSNKSIHSSGKVINISRGGILALLNKPLPVTQRVSFKLNLLKPETLIQANGRIMWSMEENKNLYYGIRFNQNQENLQ